MKMTTTRSPKFRRLMNLTGLNRAGAAGSLELLWLFVMEQSPSGDVGKWSDDDIESELAWEGESGVLIGALVDAGWLDRCEKHRLVIHDWADHLPEFIKKRVDRGTLTLVPPPADNGRQRPPPADNGRNVPIREGKTREDKGREGKGRPSDKSADSPTSRARAVWPALVSRAAKHGARWAPKPGPKQVEIVAARIADGATEVELERAVEGYIRKHGTEAQDGFDPMKHYTATTLFRASKFDANVEGSYLPDPTRKRKGGAQSRDAREVMAEARRRQAEQDAKDRPAESPQEVANVIEMSLRNAGEESA